MALRMASPYKHPKTGVYWFRKRVPDVLRPLVAKSVYQRSLATKDIAEAKRRFIRVAADVEREWAGLAIQRPRLNRRQMDGLAAEFYRWFVQKHEDDPASSAEWKKRAEQDMRLRRPQSNRPGAAVATYLPQVELFLKERDILVDESDIWDLASAATKVGAIAKETLARNAGSDYSSDPREATFLPWQRVERKILVRSRMLTMAEHFDLFAKERLKVSSRKKYRTGLRDLERFLKTENFAGATPEQLVEWKLDLIKRGLDARSIRDGYLVAARSFYAWGMENKKIRVNPMDGVTMKAPKKPRTRPTFFLDDEARLILSESLRPAAGSAKDEWAAARRWVPWLCAYTGARVNEITQLRKQDVLRHSIAGEEVWTIHITPEAGNVKSDEARDVPLHADLVRQGFLAFVAQRRPGPLFYDPAQARGASEENPQYRKVGDKLAEWVRMIGVDDPKVLPNHGWRHGFTRMARRVRMPPEIRDFIQGHKPRTVSEEYGWPIEPEVTWPEIKALPAFAGIEPPTGPLPDTPWRRKFIEQRAATAKRAREKRKAEREKLLNKRTTQRRLPMADDGGEAADCDGVEVVLSPEDLRRGAEYCAADEERA